MKLTQKILAYILNKMASKHGVSYVANILKTIDPAIKYRAFINYINEPNADYEFLRIEIDFAERKKER